MKGIAHHIIALVIVLAAVVTPREASAMYRCQLDGATRPECCCPYENAHRCSLPVDASVLAASCCCDLVLEAVAFTTEIGRDAAAADGPAIAPVPTIIATPRIRALRRHPVNGVHAARPRVATFLIKHALLR